MGWTIYSDKTRAMAIAYEMQCTLPWERVWTSTTAAIYRNKNTGDISHNFFLVKKVGNEISVKEVSDFHTVAAAVAYLKFAKEYMDSHNGEKPWQYDDAVKMVDANKKKHRLASLKPGDRIYIKEGYNYCGWGTVVQLMPRSIVVSFDNVPRNVCCSDNSVDLDKTFGE